jgi:hypothetical protein
MPRPNLAMPSRIASQARNWLAQIADPVFAFRGLAGYFRYFADWRRYGRMSGAEPIRWADAYPQVHDCTPTSPFDAHYFYVNGWAMRRIVAQRPARHMDIGSQATLPALLGAVMQVTFVDYRPLPAHLSGLACVGADVLHLPFGDGSVESLSCLHVAEHIGLGRYGDPLNPHGTRQAARELVRVLSAGASLYFALPVGKPRVCFNAHRICAPGTVLEYFSDLELVELSGVHDDGRFVERGDRVEFDESEYACGMFWFRKV